LFALNFILKCILYGAAVFDRAPLWLSIAKIGSLGFFYQGYPSLAPLDRSTYAQRQIVILGMCVCYPGSF